MDIVIAGGTGFVGRSLCKALQQQGHHVIVLTRRSAYAKRLFGSGVNAVEWDAMTSSKWEEALNGAQAVINLAGASIGDSRWTESRKRLLTESRVRATRLLI